MANYYQGDYEGHVTKNTDWGKGDSLTNNLPLGGDYVQRYIKETLNEKGGYYYEDKDNAKMYVFTDEDTFATWSALTEEEREESDIPLTSFKIPSSYILRLNSADGTYSYTELSGLSSYNISYTFGAYDANNPTTPKSEVFHHSITCVNNGVTTTYDFDSKFGSTAETVDLLDAGLVKAGTNVVDVTVTSQTTKLSASIQFTYKIAVLNISTTFNMTGNGAISSLRVPYRVETNAVYNCTINVYIDGETTPSYTLNRNTNDNNFIEISSTEFTPIDVSVLNDGLHTLQLQAIINDGDTKIYSDVIVRQFVTNSKETLSESSVTYYCLGYTVPYNSNDEHGLQLNEGEGNYIIYVKQYSNFDILYGVYNSKGDTGITTEAYLHKPSKEDDVVYLSIAPSDRESGTTTIMTTSNETGQTYYFKINGNVDTANTYSINVTESSMDIQETTDAYFAFNGKGQSNTKHEWSASTDIGGYKVVFSALTTGFDWNRASGWKDGRLIVPNGAQLEFNNLHPLCSLDSANPNVYINGKTIEMEFSVENVSNEDDIILELARYGTDPSVSEDLSRTGIVMTCSEIMFQNGYMDAGDIDPDEEAEETGNKIKKKVSTHFRSGRNTRIAFVFYPAKSETYINMNRNGCVALFIDGVISGFMYFTNAKNNSLSSTDNLIIKGVTGGTLSLKSIDVYERPLTDAELLNNYILSREGLNGTGDTIEQAYARNNILMESSFDDPEAVNSSNVDYNEVAKKLPVMILTEVEMGITHDGDSTTNYNDIMLGTKQNKDVYRRFDVQYINNQNPSLNFNMIDAVMQPQGTSSMAYPVKNFKLHTDKDKKIYTLVINDGKSTKIYVPEDGDTTGACTKLLTGKKYAFKIGATPVKTWCLKADVAESSSSHNTGVARLWNDVMKNASVGGVNVCKTRAQVLDDNVRTCVDGFPIALFHRNSYDKTPVFVGKYNFNNDKSTEKVFGFEEDITDAYGTITPECWELLNSGSKIALFNLKNETELKDAWNEVVGQDASGNDILGWADAYEARYPDDAGEGTDASRAATDLYDLHKWLITTSGASKVVDDVLSVDNATLMEKFSKEKWQHLDVWKVAAYYVYLIRFGAVDQTVKNAMLTTEGEYAYGYEERTIIDGATQKIVSGVTSMSNQGSTAKKWYFINYDNDTIGGVRNDGTLVFDWNINRQSHDPDTPVSYAYAGHASLLWNNLEADAEFMNKIVPLVDDALYTAGLTYDNLIDMLNNKQSGLWGERIFNEDANYKYLVSPLSNRTQKGGRFDAGTAMLQGSRASHREWWFANRFNYYDSLYGTGSYGKSLISFRVNGLNKDTFLILSAGTDLIYSIAKDSSRQTKSLSAGESWVYNIDKNTQIGNTFNIYAPTDITGLDYSDFGSYLNQADFANVYSESLGSKLETIILGGEKVNNSMTSPTFSNALMLKHLNIEGFQLYDGLDLTGLSLIEDVNAKRTKCASIDFEEGCNISHVEYPSTLQALKLNSLEKLTFDNIVFEDDNYSNLTGITVTGCTKLINDENFKAFVLDWVENYANSQSQLSLNSIDWKIEQTELDRFIQINKIYKDNTGGTLNLVGRITIDTCSVDQYTALVALFGEEAFEETGKLKIHCNQKLLFIVCEKNMMEGNTYDLVYKQYPKPDTTEQTITLEMNNVEEKPEDYDIEFPNNHQIRIIETGETRTFTIAAIANTATETRQGIRSITAYPRVYPMADNVSISGEHAITEAETDFEYVANITNEDDITGVFTYKWSIDESSYKYITPDNITLTDSDKKTCKISAKSLAQTGGFTLTLTITPYPINPLFPVDTIVKTTDIIVKDPTSLLSIFENKEVFDVIYNAVQADPETFKPLIDDGFTSDNSSFSVHNATVVTDTMFGEIFKGHTEITEFDQLSAFTSLTMIPANAFSGCTGLQKLIIPTNIGSIGASAFESCTSLVTVNNLSFSISSIGSKAFNKCKSLTTFKFTTSMRNIETYAFAGCSSLKELTNFENLTYLVSISEGCFSGCTGLTALTLPLINVDITNFTIGAYAFKSCRSLTEIYVNDRIAGINDEAFAYCGPNGNLNKITIGYGVKSIGSNVFAGVKATEVYFNQGYTCEKYYFVDRYENVIYNFYSDISTNRNNLQSAEKIRYVVIDNNFTAEEVQAGATIKNGFFSIDYSLYYKDDEDIYLLRYYTDETQDYIYDLSDVYTMNFAFSNISLTTFNVPSNMILNGSNTFIYSTFDKLVFNSSIKGLGEPFISSNITKIVMVDNETEIAERVFKGYSGGITVPQTVEKLGALITDENNDYYFLYHNNITSIASLAFFLAKNNLMTSTIYVMPEDYDYYYNLFTGINVLYGTLLKLYQMPEEGYINIISGSSWLSGATVMVGGTLAEQMYDGSYKYTAESGNTNTSYTVTVDGNVVYSGTVNGSRNLEDNKYLMEVILNETNTTGIDFAINRGNGAYVTGYKSSLYNVENNSGWMYEPSLGALMLSGYQGTTADFDLQLSFPGLSVGDAITVTFYVNMCYGGSTYHDILSITSGSYARYIAPQSGSKDPSGTEYHPSSNTPVKLTSQIEITEANQILRFYYDGNTYSYAESKAGTERGCWIEKIEFNGNTITFNYPNRENALLTTDNAVTTSKALARKVALDNDTEATILAVPALTGDYNTYSETLPEADVITDALNVDYTWGSDYSYISATLDGDNVIAVKYDTDGDGNFDTEDVSKDTQGYILEKSTLPYNNTFKH